MVHIQSRSVCLLYESTCNHYQSRGSHSITLITGWRHCALISLDPGCAVNMMQPLLLLLILKTHIFCKWFFALVSDLERITRQHFCLFSTSTWTVEQRMCTLEFLAIFQWHNSGLSETPLLFINVSFHFNLVPEILPQSSCPLLIHYDYLYLEVLNRHYRVSIIPALNSAPLRPQFSQPLNCTYCTHKSNSLVLVGLWSIRCCWQIHIK